MAGTQLELGNMAKSGELKEIWDVAQKTNLQFNMVRSPRQSKGPDCMGPLHACMCMMAGC